MYSTHYRGEALAPASRIAALTARCKRPTLRLQRIDVMIRAALRIAYPTPLFRGRHMSFRHRVAWKPGVLVLLALVAVVAGAQQPRPRAATARAHPTLDVSSFDGDKLLGGM